MSSKDTVAVVHRFIDEVLNQGRYELLEELWAPDMVWRGGSLGEVHGIDDYRTMLERGAGGAFSDMHLKILQTTAQDDTVALLFTNSGVHSGEFLGIPATGRAVTWLGSGFYTVRDDKITEATFAEDILGLLLQLGATELPRLG